VLEQPQNRVADHGYDLVQAVRGREPVSRRGERGSAAEEVRRGEGRLRLAQFLPVAAVDEDL
jgi:hypothetical protein